ncbi:molybdopterin-dependent oxidoreductase [Klebsiella pneumoniae]|uniref:Molybdopterin-dependent oxidoreductase n=2 Tax=Klebsiella pneumoniae TaxID=573 RepID=A0A927E166_KLEPN|nr:molybdopterin-dependent oxidoreductase [Klebsiella pneumoniae]
MSNAITEIDNTDLVFIFGYNPADSHPIVANHVINAKRNGAKIIVCDPRKIETARIADMHIALKNGSNIALLNAIGHVIIEEDLYDKSFVASRSEGFEEYRKIVEGYTPESVEEITGVSARRSAPAPGCMPAPNPPPSCGAWASPSSTRGRGDGAVADQPRDPHRQPRQAERRRQPGTRPEQRSGRLRYGCATGYLSGLSVRQVPGEPRKIRQSLGAWKACLRIPAIASANCRTARRTVKCGRRTLWVRIRCRPTPNSRRSAKRSTIWNWLSSEDIFMTKTASAADVILPSTSWGEHEGVYTAADRGFQRFFKAVEPKWDLKTDWQIISEIATRMGYPMHYNNTRGDLGRVAASVPGLLRRHLRENG